jgi:5S rRNA maturation endonuclease (ribonuclease M5)/SAM-dependent methyltransferase
MSPHDDTPIQRVFSALTAKGCNPRHTQSGYEAHCPAHEDKHKSLSISEGHDGRALIKCHAGDGCPIDKIVAELGLQQHDLFADDREPAKRDDFGPVTSRYLYTDENGKPLFRVNRTSTKKFWQERSDSNGNWIKGLGKTRRVLYRLPDVIDTIGKGQPVYIVEGEKDADAGARAGICTTTCPMGAGKWRKEYSETIRDARSIVIVADADDQGHQHAQQVARSIRRHTKYCDFKIVEAATGKDLFDHLEAGHTIDELRPIARSDDAPESPAPETTDDEQAGESATQPPGISDDEDSNASDGPELPDLDLDPDQAKSIENLMEQMKELDPENRKSVFQELAKLVGKTNQASELVKIAKEAGVDLWHDPDGNGYATIPVADHVEHWPVRSRSFRLWLRRRYYEEKKESAPGANGTRDAIELLDGMAMFSGATHDVHVRVAEWHGNVYLDLCDDGWQCIETTASGWTVRNGAPVRFKRRAGMHALPTPEHGGSVTELRPFVNVTDDQWMLALGWLIGAFHPHGPYPVLDVTGEHGNAKTTLCRALRRIIDPNKSDVRSAPRETRDLMIAAGNGWVCAFDNLSSLWPQLSDDLARLSTGTGFSTRRLYEDDEETLFDACRPIIVNGIEDVVHRPDLLDRAVILHPPRITDDARRDEETFWADYETARPRILGAVLDAVACALARIGDVELDAPPRMADFAKWVTAAEPGLGIEDGAFLDAYIANRRQGQHLALESDDVAAAIHALVMERGEWSGPAGELAELLKPDRPRKGWPVTPRAMAGALKRSAPVLRAHGIDVEIEERSRTARRWTLTKVRGGTVTTVTPSRQRSDQHEHPDESVTVDVTDANPKRHGDDLDLGDDEPNRHSVTQPSRPDPLRDKGCDGRDGRDGSPATSSTSDVPAQLTIDGKPAPKRTKHPARFSDEILAAIARAVPPDEYPDVLDPFAGTGRIHELPNHTIGVELEPEWATMRPATIVADALALPFPDAAFDAIATSPTYGNRYADHFHPEEGSEWTWRSYTLDLGRTLHPNNSGALQWGPEYRTFHTRAWAAVLRVLCPGGRFVLSISDHIRDHERQHVTDWHVETLTKLGLHEIHRTNIPTKRMRYGENADARVEAEHVITFDKSAAAPVNDGLDDFRSVLKDDPKRFTR